VGEAAEVGQTANNYQILARLATGGMAEIFLARGVSAAGVERHCVLKRILRNRASDVSFVRMFLDEARLAAQLQHPNVAQVYDIGKLGDSYFFTMEYVHGETVRAILHRARSLRRELPLASVLAIVTGAAAGLHHAHDRIGTEGRALNIVHRDVSPSNLMVSYEGGVKVVDFGVAKASDRATETRSGTVKGKISYLSPEQARGSPNIDRRSDLFSLGIVFWEMLTGERLYKRSSDFENMTAIVTEPAPAPSSRRSWIPTELDAIVMRLLSKDPNARFQTADELVEAIESFAGRSGTMISSSALSRFLREMFGQRPEPWVELDTAEVPEGVTVTSEPIPSELAVPVADDVDLNLGNVPLYDHAIDERAAAPVTKRERNSVPPDMLPTLPHPKVDPNYGADTPAPQFGISVNQTLHGTGIATKLSSSGPRNVIQSTPQHGLAFEHSSAANISLLRGMPPLVVEPDEPKKRGFAQVVMVIGIAAIIGSVTMWIVMKNRSKEPEPEAKPPVVAVEHDAAVPEVAVDAMEIVVDAAVAESTPPPIDAAIEAPPDAPEVAVKPIEKKPDAKKPKREETDKDLVARCAKAFPSNADDVKCVIAACQLGLDAKARQFYGKLTKAKKKTASAACKGVALEDKPVPEKKVDPCEADPMSCQH
jgi:serine/threonine protein kinase